MSLHHDAIVIGLGAIGAATLYQAARRGLRVLGIDRHHPPHDLGSSHGESRITRLAIGEGDAHVPLVQRSHQIWRDIAQRTGTPVMRTTGGLVLGAQGSRAQHHGQANFLHRTIDCAQRHGIDHRLMDADEVRWRFPAFRPRADEQAYFEPEAGLVQPEAAIAAQLGLARAHGARVHTGETVLGIAPIDRGGRWRVDTDLGRGAHVADRLLIATGPWLPGFLDAQARAAWAAPFAVHRQVMHWFDTGAQTPAFSPGAFPVFIWLYGDGDEDYFYGFPAIDAARPALKVATEQYLHTTRPEVVDRSVAADEVAAMYTDRVAPRLALPPPPPGTARARVCLYTVTPDRHFVVDELPGWPGVHLASACSGHGFKHSAALGEALAERLAGGPSTLDLSAFSARRPAVALAPADTG